MRAWRLFALGWFAATIVSCGVLQSQSHPTSKIVPISGLEKITGKWEGLSKRVPDMRDHAWVLFIVSEKGRFNFVSDRGTEFLLGTGTLNIQDGKAIAKSSAGTGMLTLHDQAGNPVLVIEVALNDNNHYFIEMTPVR
jgi:hypothetical protein